MEPRFVITSPAVRPAPTSGRCDRSRAPCEEEDKEVEEEEGDDEEEDASTSRVASENAVGSRRMAWSRAMSSREARPDDSAIECDSGVEDEESEDDDADDVVEETALALSASPALGARKSGSLAVQRLITGATKGVTESEPVEYADRVAEPAAAAPPRFTPKSDSDVNGRIDAEVVTEVGNDKVDDKEVSIVATGANPASRSAVERSPAATAAAAAPSRRSRRRTARTGMAEVRDGKDGGTRGRRRTGRAEAPKREEVRGWRTCWTSREAGVALIRKRAGSTACDQTAEESGPARRPMDESASAGSKWC